MSDALCCAPHRCAFTAGFGYGLTLTNAVERAFMERDAGHAKDMQALVDLVAGIPLAVEPGAGIIQSQSICRAFLSRDFQARSSAITSKRTSSRRWE